MRGTERDIQILRYKDIQRDNGYIYCNREKRETHIQLVKDRQLMQRETDRQKYRLREKEQNTTKQKGQIG